MKLTLAALTNSDTTNIIRLMVLVAIIWFVAWMLTLIVKVDPAPKIIFGIAALGSVILILPLRPARYRLSQSWRLDGATLVSIRQRVHRLP